MWHRPDGSQGLQPTSTARELIPGPFLEGKVIELLLARILIFCPHVPDSGLTEEQLSGSTSVPLGVFLCPDHAAFWKQTEKINCFEPVLVGRPLKGNYHPGASSLSSGAVISFLMWGRPPSSLRCRRRRSTALHSLSALGAGQTGGVRPVLWE